ncbi:MAG: hypothetical protein LBQ68_04985 [Clostridiales bacterium]|nr:hypothetical protein [Clostridiales bacterium]
MLESRLTVFAGHYGSGKTNLSVNYAFYLRNKFPNNRIALADLDIVNPYFRSLDAAQSLNARGIEVIASAYANTNLDAPALPSEVYSVFDDPRCYAIIDLGGDDRGANVLGRYFDYITQDIDMLLVCNMYRPLSRDPRQIACIKEEIESAAKIKFTGIVNNSNLGSITSALDITNSLEYIHAASELCGLPIVFTSVKKDLIQNITVPAFGIDPVFEIEIVKIGGNRYGEFL